MISGLQKLTLLDYPGQIACTVFLGGCNLRCPFCHNASLVMPDRVEEAYTEEEFFEFLDSRSGKLGAVCVSGGEPTLYPKIADFIRKIKNFGLLVKLDTNGTRPEVLKSLVEEGLVDYVAMDIKNSPLKYAETVGKENFDIDGVAESVDYLMKGRVDFEFRTTVVNELHTEKDIKEIGEWLEGDEKFFLQSFEDSGDIIGSGYSAAAPDEMRKYIEILKKYIPNATLRKQ